MKIVCFAIDSKVRYGILNGESIQGIEDKPYHSLNTSDGSYQLSEVKLLPPCTPAKIVALGLNYRSHAEEEQASLPNAPLIFVKPSAAVIGHEDDIVYPTTSPRVNYAGQLALVIKKPMWRVSIEDALDYVLGYTCFNNVTVRGPQYTSSQWAVTKGLDTFAAVGPCIETELDPGNAVVETYLNSELKQQADTSDLLYSVPELINFTSHVMALQPGDIIATGTPSGSGSMFPSDTVEIKIAPIGTLRNPVVEHSY